MPLKVPKSLRSLAAWTHLVCTAAASHQVASSTLISFRLYRQTISFQNFLAETLLSRRNLAEHDDRLSRDNHRCQATLNGNKIQLRSDQDNFSRRLRASPSLHASSVNVMVLTISLPVDVQAFNGRTRKQLSVISRHL